jgi:hypothetical protein
MSVLTVSMVIVGPPDFSTTRSPDLKMAIEKDCRRVKRISLVAAKQ